MGRWEVLKESYQKQVKAVAQAEIVAANGLRRDTGVHRRKRCKLCRKTWPGQLVVEGTRAGTGYLPIHMAVCSEACGEALCALLLMGEEVR